MMSLPRSWRDLSAEELQQLLDWREPLFTIVELTFAQWLVATRRTEAARKAETEADAAYLDAWQLSIQSRTGKTLLASEAAEKRRARCRTRVARAEREQRRLYAAYRAAVEAA